MASGKTEIANIGGGIDDFGDVAQADWRAGMARTSNDEGLVFVSLKELIGVGDVPGLLGVGERTLSEVRVGRLQRCAHGFKADSVAIEFVGIRLYPDGRAGASPDSHLPHSLHLGELLRKDGIGGIVNLGRWDIG